LKWARNARAGGAGLLVLLLVCGDVAACHALRHSLQFQFKQWLKNLRGQGYVVEHGPLVTDGFPWGGRLVVPDFRLSGGRAAVPGGAEWHAERVVLSLPLLHPTLLTVTPEGEQTVRAAGGPEMAFFADRLNATVQIGAGRPDQVDIAAQGLAGGFRQTQRLQDLRVGALAVSIQADSGGAARTAARMSLSARQVGLPDSGRWALGATIHSIDMDLSLASPALSGEGAAEQARAWHDWGGLLTVESLTLRWGPLDLTAVAELGLDDSLQPAGRGTARVAGAPEALDALARSGVLSAGVAQTAKAVLASMPRQPGPGDKLVLPFTLQDDTVSIGKTPLARIGTVVWGAP
jgi:hypothetical protein